MRALIQRVTWGKVNISGKLFNEIKEGFVILLGVWQKDSEKEAEIIADKTVNLRVMSDKTGKMNLSILDTKGEILVISQFTLYADTSGGNRPSFINAAKPAEAKELSFFAVIVTAFIFIGVSVRMSHPVRRGNRG